MKRRFTGIFVSLWAGIVLITYYVVQKPDLSALTGLLDTIWTLFVAALLLFNSYGIGTRILHALGVTRDAAERLLFGMGIGLGILGLLGLGVSALQLANVPFLSTLQTGLAIFFLLASDAKRLRNDLNVLRMNLHLAFSQYGLLTQLAIVLTAAFSFLLTLVPPFEAFDALLYHLAQPAAILRDGGIRALDNVPFWFPNLTENVYLWALAMQSERAAQIIHLAWGTLSALLLWHWSAKVWNAAIGRKVLLLLVSIPSLTMLASWAYADMALVFYAVAALYTLISYRLGASPPLLIVTGIFAGLAMGVKYTSFVVPSTCGLLLLFHRPFKSAFKQAAQFSLIALLIAIPWYARNAIVMDNPFYPFVFGGRYWDDFLSNWYADAGTGIGWNALQVFMLPLNVILGHRDATFFDGRLGPLFLILAPLAVWILLSRTARDSAQSLSLLSISLFAALSFSAWTLGVINSSALWQARLLLPALMAFAIPTALGWDSLDTLNTSKLRISFLVNAMIAVILALTIFENGVFVLKRNPLAVAFGAQTRGQYIARIAPSYSALIEDMSALPVDAHVYSLFEPRSYDLPRSVQPDAIVSNFVHDLYRYQTPEAAIAYWKSQGYTHVLVYETGLNFLIETRPDRMTAARQNALHETLQQLELISRTPDNVYSIYQIP